jgi:type II secretory pathway pseudopilin PulG
LIEVLAGLVLLGTILSSALVARGRFQRQWRAAEEKLAAVRAADELVSEWIAAAPGAAPVPGEGAVSRASDLRWRTTWLRDPYAQRLGARVARLEMLDGRGGSRAVLATVEFLLQPPPGDR